MEKGKISRFLNPVVGPSPWEARPPPRPRSQRGNLLGPPLVTPRTRLVHVTWRQACGVCFCRCPFTRANGCLLMAEPKTETKSPVSLSPGQPGRRGDRHQGQPFPRVHRLVATGDATPVGAVPPPAPPLPPPKHHDLLPPSPSSFLSFPFPHPKLFYSVSCLPALLQPPATAAGRGGGWGIRLLPRSSSPSVPSELELADGLLLPPSGEVVRWGWAGRLATCNVVRWVATPRVAGGQIHLPRFGWISSDRGAVCRAAVDELGLLHCGVVGCVLPMWSP
ncbi:hypothetical protein DAI22_02g199301 [Oryza sativa Japonica Group]|nr:hypothetical protein DAI22_02g199301 [Oryza sativa Japonica Group]